MGRQSRANFSLQPQKFSFLYEKNVVRSVKRSGIFLYYKTIIFQRFFLHEGHFIVDKTGLIGLKIIINMGIM